MLPAVSHSTSHIKWNLIFDLITEMMAKLHDLVRGGPATSVASALVLAGACVHVFSINEYALHVRRLLAYIPK